MATPQQQESNGRPSSSSPLLPRRFFRIMLCDVDAQKLILPEGFVQEFGDELSSIAKLTDPNKREWQVGVEKSVNDVWFVDKWNDFVEYYSVSIGDFILFKYKGNSSFRVYIMKPSTCEIRYPTNDQQPDLSSLVLPHHGEEIGTQEGVEISGSPGEISHPLDPPTSDQLPNHHGEEIGTEEGVKIMGSDIEVSHPFEAPTSDQQPNHSELLSLPHHEQELGTGEGVKVLGSACEVSFPCDSPTSDEQPNRADLSLLPHQEQEIRTEDGAKMLGSNSEISYPCDSPTSDKQPNHVELSMLPHQEQEIGTEDGVKMLGSNSEISYPCDSPTSDKQPNHVELSMLPHHEQEIGTEDGVKTLGSNSEISYPCDTPTIDQQPHHAELSLPRHGQEIETEEVVETVSAQASQASLGNINCEKPCLDVVRTWSHEQQDSLLDEARGSSSHQSKNRENVEKKYPDDDQINESGSCKSADKIKTKKRTETGKHEEDTGTSRKRRRKVKSPVVRRAATEQERLDATYRARLFRSDNPWFMKTMGKSNLQNPHVYVDKIFSDQFMKGPPGWLKLEVSDGRQWPVSYTHSSGEGSAKSLRKGWAAFHKENSLEEGDVCVFELVKKDDIVLRVEIFRAVQESAGETAALALTLD